MTSVPVTPVPQAPASTLPLGVKLRWIAVGVFVLSSSLNYLDRQLLSALAPTLKNEFHLSNTQYGQVLAVFSIVYALMAPVAGWMIDRVGLNAGVTLSMAIWSLAGMATGLTRSFTGLLASRTILGIGEAAGIPCTGKVNSLYLAPRELAFGTALNQTGITIGSIAAPLLVAAIAPVYGWRFVFVVCGALGFVWIPVWWFTSKRIPARMSASTKITSNVSNILKEKRLWGLAVANALVMTLYTLWSNWTTLYFVEQHHLTEIQANQRFAWIPPVFATLGGFTGGWMAWKAIRRGTPVLAARLRVAWIGALILLLTAGVPLIDSPVFAVVLISLSFFWCLAIVTNLYAMPIDFFGSNHAAFGVAILTGSYGLMQTVISPLIGFMLDHLGFPAVCATMAVMPLVGVTILQFSTRTVSVAGPLMDDKA